jgi:hypothetical protein
MFFYSHLSGVTRHSQGMQYTHGVFNTRSSFTSPRQLRTFFEGKPTPLILWLLGILFDHLDTNCSYSRKAVEVGFLLSLGILSFLLRTYRTSQAALAPVNTYIRKQLTGLVILIPIHNQ